MERTEAGWRRIMGTIPAQTHRSVKGVVTVVIVASVLTLGAAVSSGRGATAAATGTLNLRAELRATSAPGVCPPGVSAQVCASRPGEGLVPGLGRVVQTYTFLANVGSPTCPSDEVGKALAYTVRLEVAGKGVIQLAVAEGSGCVSSEDVRTQTQAFTVTGGTGVYQGASGRGTVDRSFGFPTPSGPLSGRETWTGTLVVPALEFDQTAPMLSGAVAKTVRVARGTKRAKVTYAVTARDATDGAVPVACSPRSGSRLPIGRTLVTCSATDTSANTRTSRFTITVKRRL